MERHKLCPAESVILDIRDGHYVCTACGLVLDSHYQDVHQTPFLEEHCEIPNKWKEETKDILTRLNIPTCYGDHILQHFESKYDKKNQKNLLDSIYTILNTLNISVTLNELSNVTAYHKTKINSKNVTEITNVAVDKTALVDKYCAVLELDFQTAAVIKERLKRIKKAGHSPTTIVAGVTYSVCKDLNLKKSIKQIASVTSVSPISIQRFIKYEHSQR